MSELHRTEDALRAALRTIREHWAALHSLASTAAGDGAASVDPVTSLDRLVSLAYETTLCLNGWCRVVVEDRHLSHGLPLGNDTIGMVKLLDRHAQWFSGHEAARDALDEIQEFADEILKVAAPKGRDWIFLGPCPFVVDDHFCHGVVRVKIGDDETATCSECGQESVVEWWEEVLEVKSVPMSSVTLPALAVILRDRMHVRVTERTLRNWHREERITAVHPFGPQPLVPRFDARVVLDQVARMDRECPMCGRVWQGKGEACSRCHAAMRDARPTHAAHRRSPRAPVSLVPPPLPGPARDPQRDVLCGYSDLDTRWCQCGRVVHNAVS